MSGCAEPGAGWGQGTPGDAAPLSHRQKGRHQRLHRREETQLKIPLSKEKLSFEQQSHPSQGREKQGNTTFPALLRVGVYARLQRCWGASCSRGMKVLGSAQLLSAAEEASAAPAQRCKPLVLQLWPRSTWTRVNVFSSPHAVYGLSHTKKQAKHLKLINSYHF